VPARLSFASVCSFINVGFDADWCMLAVMCLGQGADLHMAQLMPLRLTMSAPVNPD